MFGSTSIVRSASRALVLFPFVVISACSGSGADNDDADASAAGNGDGATATSSDGMAVGQGRGGAPGSGEGGGGSGEGGGAQLPDEAETEGAGPAPVMLGYAAEYAILAQSAITNVPPSAVTGNLGLSPAAASYITGFALTRAGTRWTTLEVTGGVFAADNDPTTPADLTAAVADMQAAYDEAASRADPDFLNLEGGLIGGLTLAPGLYRWTSSVTIPSSVTLAGAADDVWILQMTGDLGLAADQRVTLSGGAQAKNVVWVVAGAVALGTTSHAEGVILSKTAINLGAGASINGRLLAQTAVTISSATVTAP